MGTLWAGRGPLGLSQRAGRNTLSEEVTRPNPHGLKVRGGAT